MKKQFLFLLFIFSFVLISCSTKEKTYTIVYNTDAELGTSIEQVYPENHILSEIDFGLSYEGHAIEGWYFDTSYTQRVSFPYTVTKNVSFFAKWVKVHTITFVVEGSSSTQTDVLDEYPLEKPIDPISSTGVFQGWYIDPDCNTAYDFESKVFSSFSLYAKFEVAKVSISFLDDNQLLEKRDLDYNTKTNPLDPTSKEGYTFNGWSSTKDTYTPFDFEKPILKDTLLYAFYEKTQSYKVKLILENQEYEFEASNEQVLKDLDFPTKLGHTLQLFKNSDFSQPVDEETKINENITIYGKYQIQTFTISFILDNEPYETKKVEFESLVSAPKNPTKQGHTFKGWSTDNQKLSLFDFNTKITENTTLFAYFEANSYKISFYDNTLLLDTKAVLYNHLIENTILPKKEGYTFKGWSTNSSSYSPFDMTTRVTEDLNLYAFYETEVITVSLVNDTEITHQAIEYNKTITKPKAPFKEGYTFKGWSTNSQKLSLFDFNTKITEDMTLFAYYEINSYKIDFKIDTQIYETKTATYNTTIQFPANPTKEGLIFKGWSTDGTTYKEFNQATKIKENLTLYAFFAEEVTITFIIDQEQTIEKLASGNLVTEPTSPTKEGYQFLGWYLNDEKFDFTIPIEENITLIAKFGEIQIDIKACGGYSEGLFFEATPVENASISDYQVSYRKKNSTSWTSVDSELIRLENNLIRCDAVGLVAGDYEVMIQVLNKSVTFYCTVAAYDRSGYAHFNYSEGVGAYNNDGSLKSGAIIIYVTDKNKNTVTAKIGTKTYTGLSAILQAQGGKVPLVVRILGTINAATWNKIDYKTNGVTSITPSSVIGANGKALSLKNYNEDELISGGFNNLNDDIAAGITKLNGLTNRIKYDSSKKEFDSYYNMLDISSAKNVTIEGIGTNAMLYQWGFTWKNSTSIEVRNLTFDDYTEDACSFEGSDDATKLEDFTTGHLWIHNNTFNEGKNNWDVCNEQDKHEGDGATDFKRNAYITLSYNHYYKNHKTGLIGGSDSQYTACVTFHHNFYDQCSSRLPLGRQANMHMYNNYYYKTSGTNMSIRANGYAFVENCVFESVNNPFEVKSTAAIKSYNNVLTNCKGVNQATLVSSRTESISNSNLYGKNFDTDTSVFYYDTTKKASKVTNLLEVTEVKDYCKLYSGVLKTSATTSGSLTPGTTPTPPAEETWQTIASEDFSSAVSIQNITYGTTPKAPGLYYSFNDGGTAETNNLSISNGRLNINDSSTSYTTYGYYIFDSQNTGKIKISIDFISKTVHGKWTPVHFLDGAQNIGIRSNDNRLIGYTIDNGTTVAPLTGAMTENTTYHIELIVDFTNNLVSVSINDSSSVISGYSPTSIQGIMFQTATGERNFSIDNIVVSKLIE